MALIQPPDCVLISYDSWVPHARAQLSKQLFDEKTKLDQNKMISIN